MASCDVRTSGLVNPEGDSGSVRMTLKEWFEKQDFSAVFAKEGTIDFKRIFDHFVHLSGAAREVDAKAIHHQQLEECLLGLMDKNPSKARDLVGAFIGDMAHGLCSVGLNEDVRRWYQFFLAWELTQLVRMEDAAYDPCTRKPRDVELARKVDAALKREPLNTCRYEARVLLHQLAMLRDDSYKVVGDHLRVIRKEAEQRELQRVVTSVGSSMDELLIELLKAIFSGKNAHIYQSLKDWLAMCRIWMSKFPPSESMEFFVLALIKKSEIGLTIEEWQRKSSAEVIRERVIDSLLHLDLEVFAPSVLILAQLLTQVAEIEKISEVLQVPESRSRLLRAILTCMKQMHPAWYAADVHAVAYIVESQYFRETIQADQALLSQLSSLILASAESGEHPSLAEKLLVYSAGVVELLGYSPDAKAGIIRFLRPYLSDPRFVPQAQPQVIFALVRCVCGEIAFDEMLAGIPLVVFEGYPRSLNCYLLEQAYLRAKRREVALRDLAVASRVQEIREYTAQLESLWQGVHENGGRPEEMDFGVLFRVVRAPGFETRFDCSKFVMEELVDCFGVVKRTPKDTLNLFEVAVLVAEACHDSSEAFQASWRDKLLLLKQEGAAAPALAEIVKAKMTMRPHLACLILDVVQEMREEELSSSTIIDWGMAVLKSAPRGDWAVLEFLCLLGEVFQKKEELRQEPPDMQVKAYFISSTIYLLELLGRMTVTEQQKYSEKLIALFKKAWPIIDDVDAAAAAKVMDAVVTAIFKSVNPGLLELKHPLDPALLCNLIQEVVDNPVFLTRFLAESADDFADKWRPLNLQRLEIKRLQARESLLQQAVEEPKGFFQTEASFQLQRERGRRELAQVKAMLGYLSNFYGSNAAMPVGGCEELIICAEKAAYDQTVIQGMVSENTWVGYAVEGFETRVREGHSLEKLRQFFGCVLRNLNSSGKDDVGVAGEASSPETGHCRPVGGSACVDEQPLIEGLVQALMAKMDSNMALTNRVLDLLFAMMAPGLEPSQEEQVMITALVGCLLKTEHYHFIARLRSIRQGDFLVQWAWVIRSLPQIVHIQNNTASASAAATSKSEDGDSGAATEAKEGYDRTAAASALATGGGTQQRPSRTVFGSAMAFGQGLVDQVDHTFATVLGVELSRRGNERELTEMAGGGAARHPSSGAAPRAGESVYLDDEQPTA